MSGHRNQSRKQISCCIALFSIKTHPDPYSCYLDVLLNDLLMFLVVRTPCCAPVVATPLASRTSENKQQRWHLLTSSFISGHISTALHFAAFQLALPSSFILPRQQSFAIGTRTEADQMKRQPRLVVSALAALLLALALVATHVSHTCTRVR